jgi:protease-4
VSQGRFAEIYSPVRPFSGAERAKMQEHIDAIYEQFLVKAAEGRGTTRDAIHELAQGRVWTGRQAEERGLVDELGGLPRAIALAKEHVGIDAEEEVQLIVYPRPKSLFELLNEGFTVTQAAARLGWLPVSSQALEAVSAPLRMFRSGEPLTLMPSVFVF